MELIGWNYTGRVLNKKSHQIMVDMAVQIRDNADEYKSPWNTDFQTKIAASIGIKTPGQIRTLKKFMEQVGLLRKGTLKSATITEYSNIISDEGKVIINLTEINNIVSSIDSEKCVTFTNLVEETIRLIYLKNLLKTTISNDKDEQFRPAYLFAKACKEFTQLDYFEWYFLNNFVSSENSEEQWATFVDAVNKYRNGEIRQSVIKIIRKDLSHSYILKSFENVGLVVSFEDSEKLKHYRINNSLKEIIDTLF